MKVWPGNSEFSPGSLLAIADGSLAGKNRIFPRESVGDRRWRSGWENHNFPQGVCRRSPMEVWLGKPEFSPWSLAAIADEGLAQKFSPESLLLKFVEIF